MAAASGPWPRSWRRASSRRRSPAADRAGAALAEDFAGAFLVLERPDFPLPLAELREFRDAEERDGARVAIPQR